jgi:HAE1 family hydrophobic/amphiphilic exporter-1
MGQAVIGGIITSSLLTLVVVPVIYTYLDDFAAWTRRKWHPEEAESQRHGSLVVLPYRKNDDAV